MYLQFKNYRTFCTDILLLSVFVTVCKLTSPLSITRLYKKCTCHNTSSPRAFSAAVIASPPAWQISLQHHVGWNCPHLSITRNHPLVWFGQILCILQEVAPFLRCEFFTRPTLRGVREIGSYGHVSQFLISYHPIYCTASLRHWCLQCCSYLFLP